MSKLDEMIKAELEQESSEIDLLLASEGGLPDMVAASFKGSMRRWVGVVYVAAFAVAIPMFWSIYQFFIAISLDDRLFWGLIALTTLIMQGLLKVWIFMEMNRASMMREIKRLELAVAKLSQKIAAGTH